jgi:hypothetical protein
METKNDHRWLGRYNPYTKKTTTTTCAETIASQANKTGMGNLQAATTSSRPEPTTQPPPPPPPRRRLDNNNNNNNNGLATVTNNDDINGLIHEQPNLLLPFNMFVTGSSGSGKTRSTSTLIESLPIDGRFNDVKIDDRKRFSHVIILCALTSTQSMEIKQRDNYNRLINMSRFHGAEISMNSNEDVKRFQQTILPAYMESRKRRSIDAHGRSYEGAYNNSILVFIDDCDYLLRKLKREVFCDLLRLLMLESHHRNISICVIAQYAFRDGSAILRSSCHYTILMMRGRAFCMNLNSLLRYLLNDAEKYRQLIMELRRNNYFLLFIPDGQSAGIAAAGGVGATQIDEPLFASRAKIESKESWIKIL